MSVQISVIGAEDAPPALARIAEDFGAAAARRGWTLITGGLGGVMAAASRGAAEAGGVTVGVLPGYDKAAANPGVRITIPTGLSHARNVLVVAAGDAVVAVGGGYGTLSEIALALKMNKPVIGIRTWPGVEGVRPVPDAAAAINALTELF